MRTMRTSWIFIIAVEETRERGRGRGSKLHDRNGKSQRDKESRMLEDPTLASVTKNRWQCLVTLASCKKNNQKKMTPRCIFEKQTASGEHNNGRKLEERTSTFLWTRNRNKACARARASTKTHTLRKTPLPVARIDSRLCAKGEKPLQWFPLGKRQAWVMNGEQKDGRYKNT